MGGRGRWKAKVNSDGRAGQTEGRVKCNPGQITQLDGVCGGPTETVSEYKWRRGYQFAKNAPQNSKGIDWRTFRQSAGVNIGGWDECLASGSPLTLFSVSQEIRSPLVEIEDRRRSGGYCVPGRAEYWLGGKNTLFQKAQKMELGILERKQRWPFLCPRKIFLYNQKCPNRRRGGEWYRAIPPGLYGRQSRSDSLLKVHEAAREEEKEKRQSRSLYIFLYTKGEANSRSVNHGDQERNISVSQEVLHTTSLKGKKKKFCRIEGLVRKPS